jgi:hypothetical protein
VEVGGCCCTSAQYSRLCMRRISRSAKLWTTNFLKPSGSMCRVCRRKVADNQQPSDLHPPTEPKKGFHTPSKARALEIALLGCGLSTPGSDTSDTSTGVTQRSQAHAIRQAGRQARQDRRIDTEAGATTHLLVRPETNRHHVSVSLESPTVGTINTLRPTP